MKKLALIVAMLPILLLWPAMSAGAVAGIPFADPQFFVRWTRADFPVQQQVVNRSWIWGPEPITGGLHEAYVQAPAGQRLVQYFDKSRMEINNPAGDPSNLWFVTNGLLVVEMITGNIQVGDASFINTGQGANRTVAGDPSDTFPTYANLISVFQKPAGPDVGQFATTQLLPSGTAPFTQFSTDPNTQVTEVVNGFGIPKAFANFMQFTGTVFVNGQFVPNQQIFPGLYLVGLPVTGPFWTMVTVGGVVRPVMFQAFERRVLTYTPGNPSAFLTEMGNVGQHYLNFRYATSGEGEPVIIITSPTKGATISRTVTVTGQGSATFENMLGVRVVTASGQVLGQGSATITTFVPGAAAGPGFFSVSVPFTAPATAQPGFVQVFDTSPATGAIIRMASDPVTIAGATP